MKLLSIKEIDKRLDKILPTLNEQYDVEAYMKTFGIDRESAESLCRTIQYECDNEILTLLFKTTKTKPVGYMKNHREYLRLNGMIAEHNRNKGEEIKKIR